MDYPFDKSVWTELRSLGEWMGRYGCHPPDPRWFVNVAMWTTLAATLRRDGHTAEAAGVDRVADELQRMLVSPAGDSPEERDLFRLTVIDGARRFLVALTCPGPMIEGENVDDGTAELDEKIIKIVRESSVPLKNEAIVKAVKNERGQAEVSDRDILDRIKPLKAAGKLVAVGKGRSGVIVPKSV